IVGGGLAFALFFEGLARSDAAQAAFVQKSLVLWVALLAVPLLHERLGWQQGLALGALLVGQLMLSGDVASHHPAAGLLFVFAAMLLWSIEVVIARALLPLVSPALLGCVRLGVGCAALIAWLALTHSLGQLELVARTQWPLVVVTGVLLAGYVSTWLSALRRAPAVDVTAVLVLGAFITALLSLPAAHVPRGLQVAGMALLLAGVAAVVGTGRMRSAVHAR
ncbi:MAG TPA: DMT family transporter, partial [Candidatus Dormibacteraeota bacterium]|nr:DMT family transporter [Candidatus Dormibacteraeota bacterium]